MRLQGTALELFERLKRQYPEAPVSHSVPSQLLAYQSAALFGLARAFNRPGAKILEIGTGQGASALMLATAAPQASVVSLTVNLAEATAAERHWQRYGVRNALAVVQAATVYWSVAATISRDMVFVDGDHNGIRTDMVWWNALNPGGLFLCHDYSPAASAHPSPKVYATLNAFRDDLKRDFDVLIVDETKTGMAGWYRREGEVWA